MSNLKTVQGIYESFGRGDVPAILDELRDDVRWDVFDPPTTSVDGVAYLVPRTDKAGVGEFFASVAGLEIHRFEVENLLEGGNQVVGRRAPPRDRHRQARGGQPRVALRRVAPRPRGG